ncbi:MAG: M4 family metallopeptidase [Thermomonas sp.]|uniref:M4 family metallopeptidase n=1 Tax=Thermomonas sp. TaxID=1971895 RepID=UPI001EB63CED|nr:M4 family metallopeptidase [Thermomonas sp.]MBV2209120.1 M4 family metallopeptidase [Thermomonas sp.]
MKVQASLLCLAIASALAVAAAPAEAATPLKSAVMARANTLITQNAAKVHRASGDAFVARDAVVGPNGVEHVRYDRTFNGLPVIGGDVVMHSRNGRLSGTSQTLSSAVRPALRAKFSSDRAIVEAGARFGSKFFGAPSSRMVVYALGKSPVLAHEVTFNGIKADQTPTEMHYFVDATSGQVLNSWDSVHTAKPGPGGAGSASCTPAVGTGKSLTEGNVTLDTSKCGTSYRLVDTTRGNGAVHNMAMMTTGMGTVFTGSTNIWGNNLLNNAQTVAADAAYGVSVTWDYYKLVHGRNGIANNGAGAISRVHYGRNYQNAFWSDGCFCMTFGDGDNGASILPLVALDIAGHEMSHGVTSRSAGLIYKGESGGLNEATSDIFGTMVEFYANNASDPADYVMGEALFPNNAAMKTAIRWMFKPSLDKQSPDCYKSTLGNLDVHYSSGVANHFFYLLAEGAKVPAGFGEGTWANLTPAQLVCNGNTSLAGIGRGDAQKIWYLALTGYMTANTNYAGARVATINAATDLFGATSAQTNAVKAAWDAVSVTAAP